jgi:hypothetical protein
MSSNPNIESSVSQESSGSFTETRSERSFSQSVNIILRQISGFELGADVLQLLEIFDENHPEYGTVNLGFGKTKSSESEPLKEMIEFLH